MVKTLINIYEIGVKGLSRPSGVVVSIYGEFPTLRSRAGGDMGFIIPNETKEMERELKKIWKTRKIK